MYLEDGRLQREEADAAVERVGAVHRHFPDDDDR